MEFAIHIIEHSDYDAQNVRDLTKKLAFPTSIVEQADIDKGRTNIDVVVLGLSAELDVSEARIRLSRIKSICPSAQVILCTPAETEALDSTIMSLGARSFLLKPLEEKTFVSLINKMLSQIQKRKQREKYLKDSNKTSNVRDVIGKSEAMKEVLALVERVAKSPSTSVLLLGESGTGKSFFSQTIHEMSDRSAGPFIEINCAAMPLNLIESELFGYEPGAFTDAKTQKVGLIELADNGTLLLDEITETDTQTQAKLLKFLDSKKLRRLGGDEEIKVDVRIVAATNRNLREEVKEKRFREDLFYRLNVIEINIPPLRERAEDIDKIATYYLGYYKKKFKKPYLQMAPDVQALLREYPWPGNVRELINVIERAVLLCKDAKIRKVDLPIEKKPDPHVISFSQEYDDLVVNIPAGGVNLDVIERKVIEATLIQTKGNVLKASKLLGMSRGALRYKLAKHKIDPQNLVRRQLVKAT